MPIDLRLAVAAPRGIEFKQDILVIVNDKILVAMAHDNGDRTLLCLGNRLRLDTRINLPVKNILNKFANILGVHLLRLIIGVSSILGGLLDSESRKLLWFQVKVASVGTKQFGIEGDDVDFTTVLLRNRAEFFSELLTLLRGLREDVSQRNTSLKWEEKLALRGMSMRVVSNNVRPCSWNRSRVQARQPEEC